MTTVDYTKTGQLIRRLRLDLGMTQSELADRLHICSKTVSKWECGHGFPEVSMFPALSQVLNIDFSTLFCGEITQKSQDTGNLRRLQFYVCPECGNIVTSTSSMAVVCCGKKLRQLTAQQAGEDVQVTLVDREFIVSSNHEMSRDHYISFVALCSSDQLLLRKLYPEWDIQLQLPYISGAVLYWHCSKHGLFTQRLPLMPRKTRKNRLP